MVCNIQDNIQIPSSVKVGDTNPVGAFFFMDDGVTPMDGIVDLIGVNKTTGVKKTFLTGTPAIAGTTYPGWFAWYVTYDATDVGTWTMTWYSEKYNCSVSEGSDVVVTDGQPTYPKTTSSAGSLIMLVGVTVVGLFLISKKK